MRTSRPPSLTAEICPPHTDACLPPFMHLQRTETQPAVLSLTRVPTCSSVLWWLAENSRGHYGCHVRPVLKIRSQFIGSRGYRWSTDQTTSSPLHPCDPNPGPGQLKAQDWKTRMNELSPALEKLLTQQTDWIRREQTDKQVKDVLEKLLVSFLNSDIFLCLPQSEKPDASLRKCRLSFAWREERLASSIGWEP